MCCKSDSDSPDNTLCRSQFKTADPFNVELRKAGKESKLNKLDHPQLKKMMKKLLLSILCFVAITAHAQYIPTPDMAMSIPLNDDHVKWDMQSMNGNRKKILAEFVPKGQSINAWKEMVAQEITFTRRSLDSHLKKWKKMIQKADPEVEITEIELGKERALYIYRSKAFNEYSIRIFFKGTDGIYAQAYHIRLSNFSQPRVDLWNDLIRKTTLSRSPHRQ